MLPALPWYRSFWNTLLQAFGVTDKPEMQDYSAGTDFAGHPTQGFPPAPAKETMAEFGWVYAAETAISSDLASLPWRMYRKRPGEKAEPIPDHPFLALLSNPSPRTPAVLLEQQLWLDLLLTGKCCSLVTWAGQEPVGLVYLPSDRTETMSGSTGELDGIRFDGRTIYGWETLIFARMPSWRSTPEGVNGQGHIEALQKTLGTYWSAMTGMEKASRTGRPAILLSPDRSDDPAMGMIPPEKLKEMRRNLDEQFAKDHGGISLVGRSMSVDRLDYSPEELQQLELIQNLQKEVLAVTGCVPVRLGADAANYATAQEQRRGYWGDTLPGYAKLLASSYTMVARRLYRDPFITVEKDFSGVPVLQEQDLLRLQKVSQHIMNGMAPADAYAYEGLDDAPLRGEADVAPLPGAEAPPAAEAPTEGREGKVIALRWWLGQPETVRRDTSGAPLDREASRASQWRAWETKVRGPSERAIQRVTGAALKAQAARISGRVPADLDPKKGVAEDLVALLLRGEEAAMASSWRGVLREVLGRAFKAGAAAVKVALTWTPARRDAAVDAQLGALVGETTDATRTWLQGQIEASLAAGETTAQLQARIEAGTPFGASRSLAIARTEATRSVNAGAQAAWKEAEAEGVEVEQEWLSSRDASVRPAHRALDGQRVKLGEDFEVPAGVEFSGAKGAGPGRFKAAGMCVNCRCAVLPRVR